MTHLYAYWTTFITKLIVMPTFIDGNDNDNDKVMMRISWIYYPIQHIYMCNIYKIIKENVLTYARSLTCMQLCLYGLNVSYCFGITLYKIYFCLILYNNMFTLLQICMYVLLYVCICMYNYTYTYIAIMAQKRKTTHFYNMRRWVRGLTFIIMFFAIPPPYN